MANSFDTLRLLKTFFLKYPGHTAFVLLCLLFASLAEGVGVSAFLPLLGLISNDGANTNSITRAIESVLAGAGLKPTLGILLSIIVVFTIVKTALILQASKQIGYATAHVMTDLRLSLIHNLIRARWGYFINHPVGKFTNALATEAVRASKGYAMACRIIANTIQITVYLAIAFCVSWKVTVASLGVGLGMWVALNAFVSLAHNAGLAQTRLLKAISSHLIDRLHGIKTLKSMACENRLEPLLEKEILELNLARRKEVFSKEGLRAFQEPIQIAALAIGFYFAGQLWQIDVSALLVLAFLFWRTVYYISKLQTNFQKVAYAQSAYASIQNTIIEARREKEKNFGSKTPQLKQNIIFDNVCLGYEEKKILKEVSFTIPARGVTALIGPSGAGKTTIADLIIGLAKPQSGRILIDGTTLDDIDLQKWRHLIGYVPQETILFHESILINVTLGESGFSEKDVKQALQLAGIWDFVVNLPDAMGTIVGESGAKLSGGQRQRIAIARALIRNPALLILDEATTALDPGTEQEICAVIKELGKRIAILAISHQPALMEIANIVYRLEDGIIAEKTENNN